MVNYTNLLTLSIIFNAKLSFWSRGSIRKWGNKQNFMFLAILDRICCIFYYLVYFELKLDDLGSVMAIIFQWAKKLIQTHYFNQKKKY